MGHVTWAMLGGSFEFVFLSEGLVWVALSDVANERVSAAVSQALSLAANQICPRTNQY